MIKKFNHEESESGKQENRKKSGIRMCWGCLTRSLPLTRLFGLPVDIGRIPATSFPRPVFAELLV
jgi:hypothetical protein